MVIEKTADKRTIGITSGNESVLAALVEEGLFASEIDAAKFALAHAIDLEISRGTTEGAGTKWNVGSVDSDGTMKAIIQALYPGEAQPYRLIEHLMNEGLGRLKSEEGLPPDVAGILFKDNLEGVAQDSSS
ncbi:hypothetical protein [uncultured Tateyamaria sp.]|uniref:hypothetical protein n=1 Tax=uncultured Tateyamaria sp. TaxID=455651 RepID=UPI002614824F|nr:hypothetical protein [uncultured Tateyamaria sp.]